jgi:hypothetical protein
VFARTSVATRINARGYLEEVAAGVPRFTYDSALTYNETRNPWADGLVAPSTKPDGWGFIGSSGVAAQYLGHGVSNSGVPYFDVRFQGVTSGAGNVQINTGVGVFDNGATCSPGDTLRGDIGFQVIRGDAGSGWVCGLADWTAAAGFIAITNVGITPNATEQRARATRTASGTAAFYNIGLQRVSVPAGTALDFDMRVFFPVLNKGAAYLTDSVPLATLAARVGTTPQYGLLGLLKEEASTNGIQNPRCEGAVAGSPGTPPSLWGFAGAPPGVTRNIVGVGVENGLDYVDIQFSGTPTAGGLVQVATANPGATGPAASIGQIWSARQHVRLVAGTTANLATPTMAIVEYNGAVFVAGSDTSYPLSSAPLQNNFAVHTRTLSGAATNNVILNWGVGVTSGLPVDFTIRIAGPQLEQQPTPTSFMRPPVAAPSSFTRTRESLQLPVSGLGFPAGAIATRFQLARWGSPGVGGANNWLFAAGESAERVSCNMASDVPSLNVVQGGIAVMGRTRPGGTAPRDTWINGAMTWGGGSGLISWDGEVAVADASCPSPAPVTPAFYVGANWADNANQAAPIIIRYIRTWRQRLTASQLRRESVRTR